MLLYPSINELNEKADSRYTLVILAAKRARDIIDGKPIFTDAAVDRPVSIACNEIYEDAITYKRREDNEESDEAQAKAETSAILGDDIITIQDTSEDEPEVAGEAAAEAVIADEAIASAEIATESADEAVADAAPAGEAEAAEETIL